MPDLNSLLNGFLNNPNAQTQTRVFNLNPQNGIPNFDFNQLINNFTN